MPEAVEKLHEIMLASFRAGETPAAVYRRWCSLRGVEPAADALEQSAPDVPRRADGTTFDQAPTLTPAPPPGYRPPARRRRRAVRRVTELKESPEGLVQARFDLD